MSEHSKLPWSVDSWNDVISADGRVVICGPGHSEQARIDAEFTARACNSHTALVDALLDISAADPQSDMCGPNAPKDCLFGCSGCAARVAIALARGEVVSHE